MGTHPVNLAVRFFLELSALASFGIWGWRLREDGWRFALALAIPLTAAALWGTFAVPDDPSRSGSAPVPVPGILRLAIEFAFFASATWTRSRNSFASIRPCGAAGSKLQRRITQYGAFLYLLKLWTLYANTSAAGKRASYSSRKAEGRGTRTLG